MTCTRRSESSKRNTKNVRRTTYPSFAFAAKIAAAVTLIAVLSATNTCTAPIGTCIVVQALSLQGPQQPRYVSSQVERRKHEIGSSRNFKMIHSTTTRRINKLLITIPESKWRSDAHRHTQRIEALLRPGLTSMDDQINSGIRRQRGKKLKKSAAVVQSGNCNGNDNGGRGPKVYQQHQWTALDRKNPIFNFLIEYYGLKGAKGPRRLGRWSPDPKLLFMNYNDDINKDDPAADGIQIKCLQDIIDNGYDVNASASTSTSVDMNMDQQQLSLQTDECDETTVTEEIISSIMEITNGQGGIFLQNANEDDLGDILHLRGAIPITSSTLVSSTQSNDNDDDIEDRIIHGILYNPSLFYNRYDPIHQTTEGRKQLLKTIAPIQWYKSILETTLNSEPIFHCHGLHEWAMLYHPDGAPPPPSGKYQKNLPVRVSRETINRAVERRGISCTHVDALRFFAPDAGPLNHHGSSLLRTDQLRLEQKGCVHAHMDLLKIALKLQPFLDSDLLCDVLEVSIAARKLDVEASPYDVTGYGGGVVPVETEEGRRMYRSRQLSLMEHAEPIRKRLLNEYNIFLHLSFDEEFIGGGKQDVMNDSEQKGKGRDQPESNSHEYAAPERFARAQPGGLPWRKNLIDKTEAGF